MKSIMQEDSSIAKAIEKAWVRADKPQSFSIKILEEPEKNFFGLTVKSAKIAFFFDVNDEKSSYTPKHEKTEINKPSAHISHKEIEPRQEKAALPKSAPTEAKPAPSLEKVRSNRSRWSEALVHDAEKWIKDVLPLMGKTNQSFSTKVKNNNLIFYFEKSVLENADQERLLFSSFAHLLSQALKNKFKQEARGLKIILQST